MHFNGFFDLIPWGGLLLRLSSKPLCDGASSYLGVFFCRMFFPPTVDSESTQINGEF
jgi:hypothetical protein